MSAHEAIARAPRRKITSRGALHTSAATLPEGVTSVVSPGGAGGGPGSLSAPLVSFSVLCAAVALFSAFSAASNAPLPVSSAPTRAENPLFAFHRGDAEAPAGSLASAEEKKETAASILEKHYALGGRGDGLDPVGDPLFAVAGAAPFRADLAAGSGATTPRGSDTLDDATTRRVLRHLCAPVERSHAPLAGTRGTPARPSPWDEAALAYVLALPPAEAAAGVEDAVRAGYARRVGEAVLEITDTGREAIGCPAEHGSGDAGSIPDLSGMTRAALWRELEQAEKIAEPPIARRALEKQEMILKKCLGDGGDARKVACKPAEVALAEAQKELRTAEVKAAEAKARGFIDDPVWSNIEARAPITPLFSPRCDGVSNLLDCDVPDDDPLLLRFEALAANDTGRPEDILDYDQGRMFPSEVVRRVYFADRMGDLRGASVLVLGDDDLFGLAVAFSGLPREVVVLEADTRIVEFVNAVAARTGARISARVYDLRFGLPKDLERRFDLVNTDPVEGLRPIEVTLARAATALRGAGAATYFGLTTVEAPRSVWFGVQQSLHAQGLYAQQILGRFSNYEECTGDDAYNQVGPALSRVALVCTYSFYRSALVRAVAATAPSPAVIGDANLSIEDFVVKDNHLIWPANYATFDEDEVREHKIETAEEIVEGMF